jgi:hypothetical protein
MGFLPSPDSIILVFFTLFLLTIFQYVFFFSVSSNTFKEVIIKNATDIIGDKFLFAKKNDIINHLGTSKELHKLFDESLIEKNEKNRVIQKRALQYIILSGIVFGIIFVLGMLLITFGNYDFSSILPKFVLSIILIIVGFLTELYLYYLVIKPYRYTSKYEIISLLIKKIKERTPDNDGDVADINTLINCIPKLLANEKCNISPETRESLLKNFKLN